MEFTIPTDCPMVNLVSNSFHTEARYDYVTIAGSEYSGRKGISVTIPGLSVIQFHSDNYVSKPGFVLKWTCQKQGTSPSNNYRTNKINSRNFPKKQNLVLRRNLIQNIIRKSLNMFSNY